MKNGNTELLFLGMDDQVSRGAQDLLEATMSGTNKMFSKEFVSNVILRKVKTLLRYKCKYWRDWWSMGVL